VDVLAVHADRTPGAVALLDGDRRLTWREYVAQRNRLANALRGLGLTKGEHAIVYVQNSLEAVLVPSAARSAGAIPVPMNHRLVADEVAYILDHSDARAVFVSDAFLGTVERVRPGAGKVRSWILVGSERRPWAEHVDDLLKTGDPAPLPADPTQGLGGSMIYTGGTTGRPKGALRTATDPTVARRYMDDEGFVYICDRKRDMVISGGVNIYPAEIEDVLHRHPAIDDVAVFGVPDDDWGERVHAAVQPRPGQALAADEVVAFARLHMADYKVPREVSLHAELPRDPAGKLLKRVLRDPYWAGRRARV